MRVRNLSSEIMSLQNLQILLTQLESENDHDQTNHLNLAAAEMSQVLNNFSNDFKRKLSTFQTSKLFDGIMEFRRVIID